LKYPDPHGTIWLYTPSTAKFEPMAMDNFPKDGYFHPLGIDILVDPQSSESLLAAINHGKDRTTIEIFSLQDEASSTKLIHIQTVSSPWFRAPNSIRLTSRTSFYMTQDHFFTRRLPWPLAPFLPLMETYLSLPTGVVNHVQFSDTSSDIAGAGPTDPLITWSALGIPFANGIGLSPDGEEVAVASSNMNALYLYDRDRSTHALKHRETLELPFAADNVDYTHGGDILIAGHPHFPSLVSVAWNGTKVTRSPSWVLEVSRVKPGSGGSGAKGAGEKAPYSAYERADMPDGYEMRTLYQSDGSHFQSSTTGAWDAASKTLYVTGLYQEGLLICQD